MAAPVDLAAEKFAALSVEEQGDPREVLANPQSQRLQQFLSGSLK